MFWEQKKICYLCLLAVTREARVRGYILRNSICHNLQTIILFTLLPAAPPHQHLFWYHYFTILWTNKKSNNNTRIPGLSTPSILYSLYTMTMGVTLWSAESWGHKLDHFGHFTSNGEARETRECPDIARSLYAVFSARRRRDHWSPPRRLPARAAWQHTRAHTHFTAVPCST